MAQNNQQKVQDISQLEKVRREKLAELQAAGKDPFQIVKYDQTYHSAQIKRDFDELESETVSIAGRMMFKRVMGKASFCNVQDKEGRIQVYVARDDLGEEAYKGFKRMDIGDIIGVKGFVFKTKTGEISVHAKEITLLAKSLSPLPEKFHGLQDVDMRYRQRYVEMRSPKRPSLRDPRSSARSESSSTDADSWKWKLPCSSPTPAAQQHVLSRLISMLSTRMSSSVFPWSSTSRD